MPASIVTWSQDMSDLGTAAVAIGVFDGVHLGHQALLRDTVADAATRGIHAIVVTFDRDPDQIVSAATAAPQLLTLDDKLEFIAETDVDIILVVPFTPILAEMAPKSFVDSVLLSAMRPVTVHVGRDFRFGARATGDVGTLERLGVTHDFEVRPHDLIEEGGAPVTSTRIRALVGAGDVEGATRLLGHMSRVAGIVHHGRGEGVKLGFPTANVVPVPFAALPADGVYAGRAILEDGIEWAAAISVGAPPTFPEARDYLEAHLVDFDGDLYNQTITLEFFQRLRAHEAYGSPEELTEAIAADVAAALEIAGFDDDEDDTEAGFDADSPHNAYFAEEPLGSDFRREPLDSPEDDSDPIFNRAMLEAAENAVRQTPSRGQRVRTDDDLVVLAEDLHYDKERLRAIESALEAAGVEASWEPYPPANAPLLNLGLFGANTFRIVVWNSQLELARAVLQDSDPGE